MIYLHLVMYMFGLVCNPTAGNGRAKQVAQDISETLRAKDLPFEIVFTEYPRHAEELVKKLIRDGCDAILSIGGDGTLSEVVPALIGTDIPLGIIPAGTGNDFIKSIAYPKEPKAALEHILSHAPRSVDTGVCNSKTFINEIGCGFDVTVLQYAQKAKKYCHGLLPYLYGVICTLLHYRPVRLTYRIGMGEPVTEDVLVCGAANGGIIGGGIAIAPDADPKDGLLDIVIVRDVPKRKLPFYLVGLLRKRIYSFAETVHVRSDSFSITCKGLSLNVDGEIVPSDGAQVHIRAGSLKVFG